MSYTPVHHLMIMVSSAGRPGSRGSGGNAQQGGYDLDYMWRQVGSGSFLALAGGLVVVRCPPGQAPGRELSAKRAMSPPASAATT
jgi:hypothetical protein